MQLNTSAKLLLFVLVAIVIVNKPVKCSAAELQIVGSGTLPAEIGDVALRFYITVENIGHSVLKMVEAEGDKCCQQDPEDALNCESMHVMGGRAFNVGHLQKVNVSLIYPNLYPFDRVGKCNISITAENVEGSSASRDYSLSFDTSLADNLWLPNPIKAWLVGVSSCGSVDEDRTNGCKPVNCVLKYDGTRNVYNKARKRCEPAVNCMPSSEKDLPDRAIKVDSNQCKDLNTRLTAEDLNNMAGHPQPPAPQEKAIGLKDMYLFECIHGTINPDKTGCVCDPGWESVERDEPTTDSTTAVHKMCDVHDLDSIMAMKYRQSRVIMIVLGSFCGILLSVVFGLFVYSQIKMRRQQANESLLRTEMVRMTDLSKKNSFSILHEANSPPKSPKSEATSVDFESARVHTPNMPLMDGELDLRIGDIITDLRKTPSLGMWKGTCNGVRGIFPVSCAELYRPGQGPVPHFMGDEYFDDDEDDDRPRTT